MLYVFGKEQKECGADVAMELREAFILGEISVPESDGLINVEFTSKIASYPSVGKVHKINVETF